MRGRLALACVAALAFGRRSEAFCGLSTGDVDGPGDMVTCLKAKAITALDRLSRADSLPVTGSVTLVRDDAHRRRQQRSEENRTPAPTELELQSRPDDELDRMLYDKTVGLFSGRAVQIGLSELTPEQLKMALEEGEKPRFLF